MDVSFKTPDGFRIEGAYYYDWPSPTEIKAQGGRIMEADTDGEALVVFWPKSGQFSFNGDRLDTEDVSARMEAIRESWETVMRKSRRKKPFWQL